VGFVALRQSQPRVQRGDAKANEWAYWKKEMRDER
jgi:hypothetical protein